MQNFKGDALELKFIACAQPIFDLVSSAKDDFYDGAYTCGPLGDLLHDIARSPLANAISLDIFRASFSVIYDAFTHSGSFESYLTVFRDIFGSDVAVTFTVSAPGKLQIDIVAQDLIEDEFFARTANFDNTYTLDRVVYYDSGGQDGILFQSIKGFKTQYELEQMLFEMVPDGISTTITLTFGA